MVVVANVLVTIVYDEEWIEILSRLERLLDWKVRYLCGFPELKRLVSQDVLYEDVGTFLTGLECSGDALSESPKITALSEIPIEFELLDKLSKYEFMIKYMINREYDKGHERTNEIYFDLIKYWLRIIEHTKPSLVIVPYTPYTAREFMIYALSQIYGIKFLSFRRATIGYYLNLPINSITDLQFNNVVLKYNQLKSQPRSDIVIREYAMTKIREMSDLTRKSILNKDNKSIEQKAGFNKFDVLCNHPGVVIKTVKDLQGIARIKRLWFDTRNIWSVLHKVDRLTDLKKAYESYCVTPDLTKPYVYFPLHYQPEQTTAPFGNYAVYQYLPIEMIARTLPKGWAVYVKEHFITFSPYQAGLQKRSSEYYKRIAKIPNVKLVPIDIQSAELIDNSQAVATITGSAGVEGVLRGKPVLTFGSAWYNGCDGVFPVRSYTECKRILELISNGIIIDPVQMHLFIQATESVGATVNYSFSMKNLGDDNITREDTVTNMVTCISRWWDFSANNNHV